MPNAAFSHPISDQPTDTIIYQQNERCECIMFFAPIPLIRKNHIIDRLSACGATSPATAVTFAAAGVINPEKFTAITKRLLKSRVIGQTPDGRYYII